MNVVKLFKYLGTYISRTGSDLADVDSRVESAGKAFGALSSNVFKTTSVTRTAKRAVYEGEILSILLYGSESWLLTETVLQRLRCFHARCVRAMCRVTRTHTWEARISTWELTQELGLESIDVYVKRRLLRFVGHIARMPFDRTPRRMLSSWVAAPRPSGGQLMTYGRSVFKALDAFGIDHSSWSTLAQDRAAWRGAIHGELLAEGPPRRAAAAAADRLIDVAVADARRGVDVGAAIDASFARAAAAAAPSLPPPACQPAHQQACKPARVPRGASQRPVLPWRGGQQAPIPLSAALQ
jgi:hypothetical protein